MNIAGRNSRIKDVWDIAALATDFSFEGPALQLAVRATLLEREALKGTDVAALGPTYYDEPDRQAMWSRFRRQIEVQDYEPNSLAEAGAVVRAFLMPVWNSILREEPFLKPSQTSKLCPSQIDPSRIRITNSATMPGSAPRHGCLW